MNKEAKGLGSIGQHGYRQEEVRTTAAAAEGRASTGVRRCGKQVWEDTWALKASCGPVRKGEPLMSVNRERTGRVALEAHPDGQKGGRKG